jgi:hypothetical protein
MQKKLQIMGYAKKLQIMGYAKSFALASPNYIDAGCDRNGNEVKWKSIKNNEALHCHWKQGCQMVYFQTKYLYLGKFWRA